MGYAGVRHVLYISGTRADYGPARRVLQAIRATPKLELSVLVCGMHLDPLHGETWQEIARDGFSIAGRVYGRVAGDSLTSMAASVGLYLYNMSQIIAQRHPDIVLVLGDRGEQLAAAMAAAFQNIVVVHLCGGSLSGSIDDSIRHALTKFAHYHLPASEEHAQRIIQMGEDPARVKVVGLPGGDLRPEAIFTPEEICAVYKLPANKPYLLVIQHPVTQSAELAAAQITETLEAVATLPYPTLLANPNDDAGGRAILTVMQQYANRYPHIQILPPVLSRERFASLMLHAGVQVGNSSSGIVEAMSIRLAVVNIGERQRGREHLSCTINVPHEREQIRLAIESALHNPDYRQRLAEFQSPLIRPDTPEQVAEFLCALDPGVAKSPKPFLDLRR
jgi:UDP-N-acetylglucosamine 2-epimerase (non-hydrolysing)/GDP/UDP-N,N'-diacetylbacillosamine 2-epimerase (hydrolysing)